MGGRVTLRDVAKTAGVHFTTVGLALRGDKRVNESTAKRIRDVAEEMGYHSNALLSALSSYRRDSTKRFAGTLSYLLTNSVTESFDRNPRGKLIFESAKQHAESLGFKLEPFRVNSKGLTAKRATDILVTRGIEGIIVPPIYEHSGPYQPIDWNHFCAVALNYSITSPALHRVCYNHMHGMVMHLEMLRGLGYRRIGITITNDMNVRTGWHWLGAFLAEQRLVPTSCVVEPLLVEEVTKEALVDWLNTQCPDVVIVMESEKLEWIREAGWRVPEDVGVTLYSVEDEAQGISGIHEQSDLLGVAAVDFIVALLVGGRKGIPRFSRCSMIDARWIQGTTVRSVPK